MSFSSQNLRELNPWADPWWSHIVSAAADEIERLRAENARLREVLKPFAYAADDLDRENWGSGSIEGSLAHITAEDCRSARAALAEKGEK